ncbi:MAG: HAMP domain-containing histidine kinase [Deltaproteobacteria bacterium]|nr:HAMP domain-containing histidine kinase [Deltaproteobacteria bacterium]
MKDTYSIREYGLAKLADKESLSDVLAAFGELSQTGIAIYETGGRLVGELKIGGQTPCTRLKESYPDLLPCAQVTSQALSAKAGGEPAAVTCPLGMLYLCGRFVFEGDELGRVVVGPFIPLDAVPPAPLAEAAFGKEGAAAAREPVRRLSLERARVYLRSFLRVLSALAFSAFKAGLTSQMHLESIRDAYLELEMANRRLEKALHQATEASRLKSAFLATVSHELKTPLTSILGYSEMLIEGTAGALNPSQDEYARTIFEKGEALQRLIGGILELTRLESGAVVPIFKPGKLDILAAAVLAGFEPAAAAKGIGIENDVPPTLSDFDFDHEKLRAMLCCLVDNAIKFTPRGGTVSISAGVENRKAGGELGRFGAEHEEHIRITVSDSGRGIAREMFTRIFDPFYQIDSSDTREHGGLGIGLRLVKGYVELHHGEVTIESRPGGGTSFVVYLPMSHSVAEIDHDAAVPAVRI